MRLVPRSLVGRLALLVFVALVAAQAISLWLFADERGAAIRATQRQETVERSIAAAEVLEAAPESSRAGILAAASSRLVRFSLDELPLVAVSDAGVGAVARPSREMRLAEIAVSPHDGRPLDPPPPMTWLRDRLLAAGVAPAELRLSLPLDGGGWLNVLARLEGAQRRLPPQMMGTAVLSLTLILGVLWLALGRITGPLRRLAGAADSFGLDGPVPALPRGGPAEVQSLSEALARMHTRLAGMIADRTRMLAALGHDLRSPITALRLRAEMVDDDETRERMVAALDEMQEMVEATLAYARGVSFDQPMQPTNLSTLLADLAQELTESGRPVTLASTQPVTLELRRTPMRRALRNLLENAQRYGGEARVDLRDTSAGAEIVIDDDGPGIPAADLERVFDPFIRLETSRSRETGGTGLGLPIARAILRAHGGEVRLENRAEGGLRVVVLLPMAGRGRQGAVRS